MPEIVLSKAIMQTFTDTNLRSDIRLFNNNNHYSEIFATDVRNYAIITCDYNTTRYGWRATPASLLTRLNDEISNGFFNLRHLTIHAPWRPYQLLGKNNFGYMYNHYH